MSRKPKYQISKEYLMNEYVDKKRSTVDISNDIGCATNTIRFWLQHHQIPLRLQGSHRVKNIVGQKFHSWTVIEQVQSTKNTKCSQWLCQCECGDRKIITYGAIANGTRKQCRKCAAINLRCNELISGTFWGKVIKGATARGFEINISREQAQKLFEYQNGKCAISGQDLVFSSTTHSFNGTASLDRKNSNLGYIEGNIQWVHKDVNRMKWKHDEKYFLDLCRMIANHNQV